MAKIRSLNYPPLSLAESIFKINSVYEQERNRAVNKEIIAKAMGYAEINEAFNNDIYALTKYGLLQSISPSLFKISEDAENIILLNQGHPDRIRALQNIAFSPYLFGKLRLAFGEQLPSDNILCSFVIKMRFSPKTVNNVIHAYRETLKFIKEEEASVPHDIKGKKPLLEELSLNDFSEDNNCSYLLTG